MKDRWKERLGRRLALELEFMAAEPTADMIIRRLLGLGGKDKCAMCENRDSTRIRIKVNGGTDAMIDECLAPFITALQALPEDMRTIESCCGHGYGYGVINLADGRTLVIVDDWQEGINLRNERRRRLDAKRNGFHCVRCGCTRPDIDSRDLDWTEDGEPVCPGCGETGEYASRDGAEEGAGCAET